MLGIGRWQVYFLILHALLDKIRRNNVHADGCRTGDVHWEGADFCEGSHSIAWEYSVLGKPAFLVEGRKGAEFLWEAGKWEERRGKRSKKDAPGWGIMTKEHLID